MNGGNDKLARWLSTAVPICVHSSLIGFAPTASLARGARPAVGPFAQRPHLLGHCARQWNGLPQRAMNVFRAQIHAFAECVVKPADDRLFDLGAAKFLARRRQRRRVKGLRVAAAFG